MKKVASLHVHADSIASYLRHLGITIDTTHSDPIYTHMLPRLVELAEARGMSLTIFVVGKDLENPEHAERVRDWNARGHEIANHSFSHPPQIFALGEDAAREEVTRAHEIITRVIDKAPVGYGAPGWFLDSRIFKCLTELGYRYDVSLLPSWIAILLPLEMWRQSPKIRKELRLLRPDTMDILFKGSEPYPLIDRDGQNTGVVEYPVPISGLGIPMWNTIFFRLSNKTHRKLLARTAARRKRGFYYVIHPADVLDPENDLIDKTARVLEYERMDIPFPSKMAVFNEVLSFFEETFTTVTMSEQIEIEAQD